MPRYFKMVCTWPERLEWMVSEFRAGRVRFGWSGPGTDLQSISQTTDWSSLTEEQRISWRYAQFLVNRLKSGDRVVIQFERPLRQFYVAEVNDSGYEFDGKQVDFNHILTCKPLLDKPIDVTSDQISYLLRKVLSHRGAYFEIYPENCLNELDRLVTDYSSDKMHASAGVRTDQHELKAMWADTLSTIAQSISTRWIAHDFEKFVAQLLESIPGVAVKRKADVGMGWDLLMQVYDPISNEVLLDEVPVQCKNYTGKVETEIPIDDLRRSIRNLPQSTIAYLFILGELDDDYRARIAKAQEDMCIETKRNIQFRVIDQDLIAELYMKHLHTI